MLDTFERNRNAPSSYQESESAISSNSRSGKTLFLHKRIAISWSYLNWVRSIVSCANFPLMMHCKTRRPNSFVRVFVLLYACMHACMSSVCLSVCLSVRFSFATYHSCIWNFQKYFCASHFFKNLFWYGPTDPTSYLKPIFWSENWADIRT